MPMIRYANQGRMLFGDAGMIGARNPRPVPSISGPLAADLTVSGLDAATFTRSTTGVFTDYEGVLRTAAINEPRFEGGRRVKNLCLQSEAMATSPWTQTNITTDANSIAAPDGAMTADTMTATADNATRVQTFTRTSAPFVFSIYLKRKTGTGAISLSLDGGSTYTAVAVTSDWQRFYINQTIANPSVVIKISVNGDAIYAWGTQLQDITGSAYTLPSEYIPTDGVTKSKWFTTKPDGSPIYPAPKLLMEGQSQNKVTAKTANPVDTTGVAKSGDAAAVLSVVDDAVALAAAGLSATCPSGKVYKLDNSAGTGISYVVVAGLTGNTNVHTFSLYVRGSSVVRLYESGDIQRSDSITLTSAYQRSKWSFTPTDANRSSGLRAPAGAIVYFILPVFEELAVVSSVIPNDTGSALTRTADACSWPLSAELQAMLSIDKAWTTSLADETTASTNQCDMTDATALFKWSALDAAPFANAGKMVIMRDSSNRLAWGFLGAVSGTTGCLVYKDQARTIPGYVKEASVGAGTTFDVVADCKAEGTVVLDWVPGHSVADQGTNITTMKISTGTISLLLGYGASGLYAYDGTLTTSPSGLPFAVNDNLRCILRYSTVSRKMVVSYVKNNILYQLSSGSTSFDGAFPMTTVLELHKSNPFPSKYSGLKLFKRYLTDNELMRLQ